MSLYEEKNVDQRIYHHIVYDLVQHSYTRPHSSSNRGIGVIHIKKDCNFIGS